MPAILDRPRIQVRHVAIVVLVLFLCTPLGGCITSLNPDDYKPLAIGARTPDSPGSAGMIVGSLIRPDNLVR